MSIADTDSPSTPIGHRHCHGCRASLADQPAYFKHPVRGRDGGGYGVYSRVRYETAWCGECWDGDVSNTVLISCTECGHEFGVGLGRYDVYTVVCSWQCTGDRKRRLHRERKKVTPQVKLCEVCGDDFYPKRSDAKTCSPKCRKALSRGVSARR